MTSLALDTTPLASSAHCTENELVVTLADGRVVSVPLAWFPRLTQATAAALASIELLGSGEGLHWPELDEDISVAGLLQGQASLRKLPNPQTQRK